MAPPNEYPGYFDATSVITIICAALAIYNSFELILLIFTTFHEYQGLYFWSLVIATMGIIPYVIGMEIMFFAPSTKLAALIVNNIGWITMVVAQSVVLYSRLGILMGKTNETLLKCIKWMIIIDAIVFYTLATVIVMGMHYSEQSGFRDGYIYVERLQMTGFCIQEFILSGIYIWRTTDILQAGEKKHVRRTLWQLLIINIVIIALDVALLVMEYLDLASIQIAFKPLVYSVKLKLEFSVLSKLVESSSLAQRNLSISFNNTIALDDDRPSLSMGIPSSPHFVTSAISQWPDEEKGSHKGQMEHRSHESLRTTSHQTDCNSEQHLFGPPLSTVRTTASGRAGSDSYHDMIKVLSSARV